jgi:hypothetical protein
LFASADVAFLIGFKGLKSPIINTACVSSDNSLDAKFASLSYK